MNYPVPPTLFSDVLAERLLKARIGQLLGVDPIPLVALARVAPPIAHHHPVHPRAQQLVQPLRLGPFLEHHVDRPAHPANELPQWGGLRRQNGPGDHPPARLPDDRDRGCLMHIEPTYFVAVS
jgi:hypothetical protein